MKRHSWLEIAEAGSVLGLRIVLFACDVLGRPAARALLYPIVAYYALFHATARRASRRYFAHLGIAPSAGTTYRHLLRFAQCALDRLFLLRGRTDLFEVTAHGHDHLLRLQAEKRGAILLGAHLGSFEAMRAQSGNEDLPINIVGYFRNAANINSVLERAGCNVRARLIEVEPASMNFVLRLRELIERGEMVAVLGDRVIAGDAVSANFLGAPARFSTGAFALAAMLRCPVYLTFALHKAPNRYDVYCEPFAEHVELPRKARKAALEVYVQRFAQRLEHYCRMAPDNWFNFYDFWDDERATCHEPANALS
jgi:predicted LPLAT superfamily acyltransferase